jgi:DNA replication protein DnaC
VANRAPAGGPGGPRPTLLAAAADRQADLQTLLRALNLRHIAAVAGDLALRAAKSGLSHEAFLHVLAQQEVDARARRRVERLLHRAGLPPEKTFRTLRLDPLGPALRLQLERLRTGAFVAEAVNVIAVGPPGVGKSHLAAALGHELVLQGHPVLWTTAATLVQRLLAAKRDPRPPQELAKLDRFPCLVLDDIGYVQHDRDEMEVLLFTLLAERYERRSVVLTTNLVFSDWNRIFKDPMTTVAAIDRVVHHSVILDLMGVTSYRAKEAQQHREARPAVTAPSNRKE